MLRVGDRVPEFTLPLATAAGSRAPVPFSTVRENGPVLLSFFPLAFTSVCTAQMCEARDAQATLAQLEPRVSVAGFSIDSVATNVAFARHNHIPFGIYSDANREVVRALWETQTVIGVRDVAKRGWILADREGVVRALWVTDDADAWSGIEPIQAALRGLSEGER